MSSLFVTLENAFFEAGGSLILQDISLKIWAGQLITLIGPNGAGKSTLLKMVLGLLKPTWGAVHKKRELRMGYVPQKLVVNPLLPLSVECFLNLTLGKKHSAQEGLEQVGASALLKKSFHHLSGGEAQKVLLAKAMMHAPHLLVLDEPTQGLDIDGQGFFYGLLQKIRERSPETAIILASHDLYVVLKTSDQVACLNHHICCMGHPEVVQQDPHYLRLFGNLPALAPYAHLHTHTH